MRTLVYSYALTSSILIILSIYSSGAQAQAIDDCMHAEPAEALTLCTKILENGSRNANVYWKLSSAQYQSGNQDKAIETLNDALRLHPGNKKLTALQDIILSDSTEQEMLERAAELNQRSIDQGALKISCLTKSGTVGISACTRRLELTDDDGDRVRARLAELNKQQNTETTAPVEIALESKETPAPSKNVQNDVTPTEANLATTNITPTEVDLTTTDSKPKEVELTTTNAEQLAAEQREKDHKKLVIQIQSHLNELGFPTGTPDGFPGSKTRNALRDFYIAVDETVSQSITDSTLEDLIFQKRKLDNARLLLKDSEAAIAQNNIALAQSRLADAKTVSTLLKVPEEFQRRLQITKSDAIASTADLSNQETLQKFGEPATSQVAKTDTAGKTKQETLQQFGEPTTSQVAKTDNADKSGQNEPQQFGEPETIAESNKSSLTPEVEANAQSVLFADLMNQIKTLHGKIKRVEEDQARRFDQIRQAL